MWVVLDGVKVCVVVLSEVYLIIYISEFFFVNEEINIEFFSLGCLMKVCILNKFGY